MSVHEYARRDEQRIARETRMQAALERPTTPLSGPDILEELAEVQVRMAITMRELAQMWREGHELEKREPLVAV